jgi:hypothetical protein
MPIKKSELYSSLWASCDELRGGMDGARSEMLRVSRISIQLWILGVTFSSLTFDELLCILISKVVVCIIIS